MCHYIHIGLAMQLVKLLTVLVLMVKEGHTAKERRRGAHLHYIGC